MRHIVHRINWGLLDNGWPLSYISHHSRSVALPCPMGASPWAGGCGSDAFVASDEDIDAITSDKVSSYFDFSYDRKIACQQLGLRVSEKTAFGCL